MTPQPWGKSWASTPLPWCLGWCCTACSSCLPCTSSSPKRAPSFIYGESCKPYSLPWRLLPGKGNDYGRTNLFLLLLSSGNIWCVGGDGNLKEHSTHLSRLAPTHPYPCMHMLLIFSTPSLYQTFSVFSEHRQ